MMDVLSNHLMPVVISYVLFPVNFQEYAAISTGLLTAVMSSEAWVAYAETLDLRGIHIPLIFQSFLSIAWQNIYSIHFDETALMIFDWSPGRRYYHWWWARRHTSSLSRPRLQERSKRLFQARTPLPGSCTVRLHLSGTMPNLRIGFTNSSKAEAVFGFFPIRLRDDIDLASQSKEGASRNQFSCLTLSIIHPLVPWGYNNNSAYMNGQQITDTNVFHWPHSCVGRFIGADVVFTLQFGIKDRIFTVSLNGEYLGQLNLGMYQDFLHGPKYPFIFVQDALCFDRLDLVPVALDMTQDKLFFETYMRKGAGPFAKMDAIPNSDHEDAVVQRRMPKKDPKTLRNRCLKKTGWLENDPWLSGE